MDVKNLMDLINAKCNDDARRAGVMTLGGLRDGLAVLPPDTPVFLPDGDTPYSLSSYRGYYERLAIEPSKDYPPHSKTVLNEGGEGSDMSEYGMGWYQPGCPDVDIAAPCTTGELIKALDLADGERFEGYKGGQNVMDRYTFMHVAGWGDYGPFVSALRVETDRVVIETAEEEF